MRQGNNKRRFLFVAVLVLILLSGQTAFGQDVLAVPFHGHLYVDGISTQVKGYYINANATESHYKLRDIAYCLSGSSSSFDIQYNQALNIIELIPGSDYSGGEMDIWDGNTKRAVFQNLNILVQGRQYTMPCYTIENNTYIEPEVLEKFLEVLVSVDILAKRAYITTALPEGIYRSTSSGGNNLNALSKSLSNYGQTIKSYITYNNNEIQVVDISDKVYIDNYDQDFNLTGSKTLEFELPIFGAYFKGGTYHYIAWGDNNENENNNKEVIRIVKYDSAFNKVDSLSIDGRQSHAIKPFSHGSASFAESDDGSRLVLHACRTRYKSPDGLNHQSQFTILVDTSGMTILNDLVEFQQNHVSHSFNQFALFEGKEALVLDHGDAYPRSLIINSLDGGSAEIFSISGKTGDNYTGVSVGDFIKSSTHYLAAYNSIDQKKSNKSDIRDIHISAVPRNRISAKPIQTKITSYENTGFTCSIPYLTEINENSYLLSWQEFSESGSILKYVIVDSQGVAKSAIGSVEKFNLTDCTPIAWNGRILWYENMSDYRLFYTIDINGLV